MTLNDFTFRPINLWSLGSFKKYESVYLDHVSFAYNVNEPNMDCRLDKDRTTAQIKHLIRGR